MHRVWAFSGWLFSVLLSIGVWAWLGRPVSVPDAPDGQIPCVSYAPTSEAGSPLQPAQNAADGFAVPAGLIDRDLTALSTLTHCIRVYSVLGPQADAVPIAAAHHFQVLLGIWIGSEDLENEREIRRALALARAYPDTVRALVVGNEVLLRGEMSAARLSALLRRVKALTAVPVAYAEVYDFWRRNPEVAEATDLMLVHILPYWDDPAGPPAAAVLDRVRDVLADARMRFPGKTIEIGEVGWPSAGRTRGQAVPSRVNQARVLRMLAAASPTLGVRFNVIEGIDQPWKRGPEGTVGGYWGLLDAARNLKFPLQGPVSEWPEWRMAAGFTALLVTAAFVLAALRLGLDQGWRWLRFGIVAAGAGFTLLALQRQVSEMAIGWLGGLWGAALYGLAAAGAVLLLRLVLGARSRWNLEPAPLSALGARAGDTGSLAAAWTLGWTAWTSRGTAAIVALLQAVDGRYRDFLTLAYLLPAVALAVQAWTGRGKRARVHQPEAGWLAAILLVCGFAGIDTLADREAWFWALCCAVLAAPWLPHTWDEARRLVGTLRSNQQQSGHDDSDGRKRGIVKQ